MSDTRKTITVTETIHIMEPPEVVFDYTQDYRTRADWDPGISEATLLGESPRRARVEVPRLGRFTVEYQLFRRGDRTSAAFTDVDSAWISGGGGSWRYEAGAGGTDWTQTNTFELRHPRLLGWLSGLFEGNLRSSMRRAMANAKSILETSVRP
jgi:hypothetical protein